MKGLNDRNTRKNLIDLWHTMKGEIISGIRDIKKYDESLEEIKRICYIAWVEKFRKELEEEQRIMNNNLFDRMNLW